MSAAYWADKTKWWNNGQKEKGRQY
jgi:hypothetical protein